MAGTEASSPPDHLQQQVGANLQWLLIQSDSCLRGCSRALHPQPPGPTGGIQIQTLASNLIAFLGGPTALPPSGSCNVHVQFFKQSCLEYLRIKTSGKLQAQTSTALSLKHNMSFHSNPASYPAPLSPFLGRGPNGGWGPAQAESAPSVPGATPLPGACRRVAGPSASFHTVAGGQMRVLRNGCRVLCSSLQSPSKDEAFTSQVCNDGLKGLKMGLSPKSQNHAGELLPTQTHTVTPSHTHAGANTHRLTPHTQTHMPGRTLFQPCSE